jgi:serine/threonine protein kinase
LGSGCSGEVKKVKEIGVNSSIRYAVKSICKKKILKSELYLLYTELQILKKTRHPYVVKYFYSFQDSTHYHIVMEYCSGGELFTKAKDNSYTIPELKNIISQMTSSIAYLHSNDICHR